MKTSTHSLTSTIGHFFRRFHMVLCIVVLAGALIFVVLTLNSIIQLSSAPLATTSDPALEAFDESTIERIRRLKTSDEAPSQLTIPRDQRTNPFYE